MDAPTYASVATLAAATDIPMTPTAEAGMLRHLSSGARQIEGLCGGRHFYPTLDTRTFDWPDPTGRGQSNRLWLDDNELLSVTSMSVGGAAFTAFLLRPDDGPPYRWIEPDETGTADYRPFSAGSGGTQQAISITGLYGHNETLATVAGLDGAIVNPGATTINVDNGAGVAAGDALKLGTEYVLVEATRWVDTTDDLTAALAVDATDTAIPVTDGGTYTAGEWLRINRERFLITDIVGNTLYVDRSADASVIAAHSIGDDIWARRALTVTRGALGTTAATHSDAATVSRHAAPSPVEMLNIAVAEVSIAQERAAWARTVGSGENEREARGAGLKDLRKDVKLQFGQRGRVTAAGGRQ
jgi:hypothetical protein